VFARTVERPWRSCASRRARRASRRKTRRHPRVGKPGVARRNQAGGRAVEHVKVGRSLRERRLLRIPPDGVQASARKRRTARPTFGLCRRASISLRSAHGFAHPRKAASRNSAMGSRRQLILYHDQLRAAGQKPTVPGARRALAAASELHDAPYRWRRRAGRHEIQSREIHLALPPVSAYAGSSPRDHCVPTRAGNGNNRQELEKVRSWKIWRVLATRFLRPLVARSSRTRGENQLHPDESSSQRPCASEPRIGCGYIVPTTARRRLGRAGSPLAACRCKAKARRPRHRCRLCW
jgi:hypothetical protein